MTTTTELPYPAVTGDKAKPLVDPSQPVAANAGQISETDAAKIMRADERISVGRAAAVDGLLSGDAISDNFMDFVTADGFSLGAIEDDGCWVIPVAHGDLDTADPDVAAYFVTRDGFEQARMPFGDAAIADDMDTSDPDLAAVIVSRDGFEQARIPKGDMSLSEDVDTSDPDTAAVMLTRDGFEQLRIPKGDLVTVVEIDTTDPDLRVVFLTLDGYVQGSVGAPIDATPTTEIVAARGTRPALADRIGQYLNPYGMPRQAIYAPHRLRRTHMKLKSLQMGDAGTQFIWNQIADSWGQNGDRWITPCSAALFALPNAGDAGGGYQSFGVFSGGFNAGSRPTLYKVGRTGTWIDTDGVYYKGVASPDTCASFTSTAGARYTLSGPDAALVTKATHFWIGTADGVIQYRWNGGAWTQMNVQGAGLQFADLGGIPASGAWTLDMELVSGSWEPAGNHYASTARGVRCNKLAASGSTMQGWAAKNAAQWSSGLSSLGGDLVSFMLLTNDRSGNRTPSQFYTDTDTMLSRTRAALPSANGVPYCDLLMMIPPQSTEALTYPQSAYVDAVYQLADIYDAALIDFQPIVGPPGTYNSWLIADGRHPDIPTMGRLLTDTITKTLINA